MRKIIIKIPKNEFSKWSVQQHGVRARRFVACHSVLNRFERVFPRKEFKEKTAIVVKEYVGGMWENVNETVASIDPNYLLYTAACFLEDYISDVVMRKIERRYLKTL